jgi:hypothetical protein
VESGGPPVEPGGGICDGGACRPLRGDLCGYGGGVRWVVLSGTEGQRSCDIGWGRETAREGREREEDVGNEREGEAGAGSRGWGAHALVGRTRQG